MPRKYEGEPERGPSAEKIVEALGAAGLGAAMGGVGRALNRNPKPVGEIRKQQGKPKFNNPGMEKNRRDEKRTFKYRPMA